MINLNKNSRSGILLAKFSNRAFILFISVVFYMACKPKTIVLKSPPGYNFQAFQSKKLDTKLREISGLVWDKKRNFFVAEEDEAGNLYLLDKNSKDIIGGYNFESAGDYEDIAMIDTVAYVLRSDGTIFKTVVDPVTKPKGVELNKLELPGKNEFETLYYDPDRRSLIMICKSCEGDQNGKINAYAYYVDSIGFDPKPVFQIDRSAIEKLAPQKSSKFQPSAAAIHPKQNKLYILSASSRQLAITDLNGKVEGVYVLMSKMFPQAEGICFQKDGTMYISNEGGNGRASLLSFSYTESEPAEKKQKGTYNFSQPDDKMELGKHLHEISGMAWIKDKNVILAENDEKGDIYQVDFANKKDNFKKIKFGGHGDYEDIVHTDTADYLLISSGTIVQVIMNDSVVTGTKEYTLDKKGTNEYETLYLDSASHSLIMLCKKCAGEKENSRSAFRFDLATHQFDKDPLYTIDIHAIKKMLNDENAEFKPSAAAIHPLTGQLFIIASVGKLLVIADKNGIVQQVVRLDPALYNQPEGITFAPNGDLYISNEGGEGVATILKFIYKP